MAEPEDDNDRQNDMMAVALAGSFFLAIALIVAGISVLILASGIMDPTVDHGCETIGHVIKLAGNCP